MESPNRNSQPQNTDRVQSAFSELSLMLGQGYEPGEEMAIKQRIWENICERLNQLEREQISFREAQRGKNGT